METNFGERPTADASIHSPQSEAVANELQELSLQPAPNAPPVRDRTNVLQLKLQQRRSREELVNQGIMPPLKSSAAFNEQRRSLERARTEDYLKRKIKSRPERSELIRMHILEETSAEPSLQAKQLQLKRARLADDLNDKISHRPGPMELIHKNILPVHSSIKQAFIETQLPKAPGDNSSCDEDSNYSLSPELPGSQESPLGLISLPSPPETLAGSCIPSPAQVPPPAPPLPPISGSSPSFKLTNEMTALSAQRIGVTPQLKCQPKPNSDRSAQRHRKPKDNKPKIKKLKYHQYIPPDQKGDKEPPPHLDSSYAKILQQQQLFLQLQILSQQQQHYNYHTILPAPPKPHTDPQPSSSSSSVSMTTSFPHRPAAATAPSNSGGHNCQSSAPLGGTKPVSLPPNLDEMKVAELKSELKLRSLPVSGTKTDLIERLRSYQELNGGGDSTSSPTAGGTTGPGAEGALKGSNIAATTTTTTTTTNNNNSTSQQPFQFKCHQTSSPSTHTAGSHSGGSPAEAASQQLLTCDGVVSPHRVPLTPSDCSPSVMSPEDSNFSSDPLGEMMSSPLTQLSLQPCSAAQLALNIKEEPSCSTPAPCQLPLKPAPLQKYCMFSSASPLPATAPVVAMDKDKMLQEKDKQIEELTRMLRQKQRLVEVLRTQLEHGKRGGRVSEPLVLLKVKQEPPDKPSNPLSFVNTPYPSPPSSVSCEINVAKVTVKEEAMEAGEVLTETAMQLTDAHGLPQPSTQTQEEIQLQIKSPQMSKQSLQQKQQHVHLPHTTLQVAQQQAIQKLLLEQQHNHHNQQQTNPSRSQPLENQQNLQKLSQQRKKKSHKLQLKLQQQHLLQSQHQQQSRQHQQQMQLKQQILLKQQKSFQLQQNKQQQHNKHMQQIQIQTKIQLKQQQVLNQEKPQVSLCQQSSSAPSLPVDLLKSDSTPTLVTDGNGNHFLITLTNHLTENQRSDAPGNKASCPVTLQRLQSTPARLPGHSPAQLPEADNETKQSVQQHKTKAQNGLQVSVVRPEQEAGQCLSAPPTLQPFFRDQETNPSGKNTSSPPPQAEMCPSLDALLSLPSPASIKTAASSPDNKDTGHEEDFIDIILQTGEMSSAFKPAPDPSLDHLSPSSPASFPPPSPLQLLLSPPVPPSVNELQTPAGNAEEEKPGLGDAGTGRLEDFLESTTGKPLLGVEPGVLLTLIDDLHSQMLCTPSILDRPLSPMDTMELTTARGRGLDSMDWLDFTSRAEDAPTLAPLGPQSPPSVFSTDFLDGSDLQLHWDSCL